MVRASVGRRFSTIGVFPDTADRIRPMFRSLSAGGTQDVPSHPAATGRLGFTLRLLARLIDGLSEVTISIPTGGADQDTSHLRKRSTPLLANRRPLSNPDSSKPFTSHSQHLSAASGSTAEAFTGISRQVEGSSQQRPANLGRLARRVATR
jgi:hypothetical protein